MGERALAIGRVYEWDSGGDSVEDAAETFCFLDGWNFARQSDTRKMDELAERGVVLADVADCDRLCDFTLFFSRLTIIQTVNLYLINKKKID